MGIPDSLKKWRDSGGPIEFEGDQYFVHVSGEAASDGAAALIVHGFPGSSWDWSGVVPHVAERTRVVVPDMLGYGMSDKPADGNYSIFKSADMYEAVAKEQGLRDVVLAIHDLGQTVGSELMMRQEEGKLSFNIKHAVVFDGSTLVNMIGLQPVQKTFLDMPDKKMTEDLPREALRTGIAVTFSKDYAASEETLDIMMAQIYENQGDRLMPRLIRYLNERHENLERWTDGLTKFTAPESLYWGVQDPVAKIAMADKIKELSPGVALTKWADVGHWPSIEVPDRVAKAITDAL
jgi:pimeloyl-ACP methyl ester carboxylesterase